MTDEYLKNTFYKNMISFRCSCGGELNPIFIDEKKESEIEGLFECKNCGKNIAKRYRYEKEV